MRAREADERRPEVRDERLARDAVPARDAVALLRAGAERARADVAALDTPRTLLLSSYVRSEVEPCCDRSSRSWIWMAACVLRLNCPFDIRINSSATCRSVLRKRSEYDTEWMTPENARDSLNIGESVRRT